jgi:hypothetical protein
MPLRRGWGILGWGFYKDVAPTALGTRNSEKVPRINAEL